MTLNNGDRIALTPNIRILFEVQDLAVASPATVSRAGMVYLDIEELGWQPHVTMWIQGKREKGEYFADILKELVEKYMSKVLKVKKLYCTELAKTSETACVINMCKLFDALCSNLKKENLTNGLVFQTCHLCFSSQIFYLFYFILLHQYISLDY